MRRAVLIGVSAIAAAALAKPPPPAPPATWGDWVGDYTGTLAWTACTVDGAGSATLALDATDGAVTLDLTPAGAALPHIALAEGSDGGFTGRRDDVTVRLARPRPDALALAVVLDSGCEVHGTLRRRSTGILACDRLAGWARVEARCTKLTRPALENVARLVRQRRTWLAVKGAARDRLAQQCDARAQKVELELVDAGCAPVSGPATAVRSTECQTLRASLARLQRCNALPPDIEIMLEQQTQNAVTESECRATRARIVATSQQVGCIF